MLFIVRVEVRIVHFHPVGVSGAKNNELLPQTVCVCLCVCLCVLQFMGKWYKVAMVSTCSHQMRRYSANPRLVAVELEKADSATNVSKTTSLLWSD